MLIIIFIIIAVESTSGTEVDKLPSAMNQEKGVQVLPATTFEKRHLGNNMNYETVKIVLNTRI
jgi:hypothetical protein